MEKRTAKQNGTLLAVSRLHSARKCPEPTVQLTPHADAVSTRWRWPEEMIFQVYSQCHGPRVRSQEIRIPLNTQAMFFGKERDQHKKLFHDDKCDRSLATHASNEADRSRLKWRTEATAIFHLNGRPKGKLARSRPHQSDEKSGVASAEWRGVTSTNDLRVMGLPTRSASSLSVSSRRRDTVLAPSASMSLRSTRLPDCRVTTPLDFFSSCLFYYFRFKHSATHVVDKDFFCQTIFVQ